MVVQAFLGHPLSLSHVHIRTVTMCISCCCSCHHHYNHSLSSTGPNGRGHWNPNAAVVWIHLWLLLGIGLEEGWTGSRCRLWYVLGKKQSISLYNSPTTIIYIVLYTHASHTLLVTALLSTCLCIPKKPQYPPKHEQEWDLWSYRA